MSVATDNKGAFVRTESMFRNWISADGSSGFKAEPNRYHLYVSMACPWACRTLVVRALKGLQKVISVTCVDWLMKREVGWSFTDQRRGCQLDTVNGKSTLREIYQMVDPQYNGRVTVPVLWDMQQKTVVNNESSEIIQMLNSQFNEFCATPQQKALDLYPESMKEKIDEINGWIYADVNNGVYKSGFAQSQEAYDEAVVKLFLALDKLESILEHSRFLLDNKNVTLADVRLFTTLIRFDWVYNGHFKCNKKKLIEYPNLWGYTRDVYNLCGVSETVDREHIIKHYYASQLHVNPTGIWAVGPDLDLSVPKERRQKFGGE